MSATAKTAPTRWSRGIQAVLAASLLGGVLAGAPAHAVPSFALSIEAGSFANDFNVPRLVLANTSSAGERITGFTFLMGDPDFFFDFVLGPASSPRGAAGDLATEAGTGAILVQGDRRNDRSGGARLQWSFSDFDAAEVFRVQVDVDPVSAQSGGSQSADARRAFFNNGSDPNAVVGIAFDDGSLAALTLPDAPAGDTVFAASGVGTGGASVPEPDPALLTLCGLLGLAWAGSRRGRERAPAL